MYYDFFLQIKVIGLIRWLNSCFHSETENGKMEMFTIYFQLQNLQKDKNRALAQTYLSFTQDVLP